MYTVKNTNTVILDHYMLISAILDFNSKCIGFKLLVNGTGSGHRKYWYLESLLHST